MLSVCAGQGGEGVDYSAQIVAAYSYLTKIRERILARAKGVAAGDVLQGDMSIAQQAEIARDKVALQAIREDA